MNLEKDFCKMLCEEELDQDFCLKNGSCAFRDDGIIFIKALIAQEIEKLIKVNNMPKFDSES